MTKDQFEGSEKTEARNIVTGKISKVRFTTDHAASSYGQAVMVIAEGPEKGQAVDRAFYEILGYDKEIVRMLNKELSQQEQLKDVIDGAMDKEGGTA